MKIFIFNNSANKIEINKPEILLVKEFNDLWNNDKSKDKNLAIKQFTYIWLMLDWESPYAQYEEQERHTECIKDSKLTEKEFDLPIFRVACRKYRELQESSKIMRLIKAAQGMVDKLTDYFNDMDLQERDENTGKPIYKAKDVMNEMQSVSKIVSELKTLEVLFKKQQEASPTLRSGAEDGFDPGE